MSRATWMSGVVALAFPALLFAQGYGGTGIKAPDTAAAQRAATEKANGAAAGAAKTADQAAAAAGDAKAKAQDAKAQAKDAKTQAEATKAGADANLGEAAAKGHAILEKGQILDVNSATKEELETLPGIGERYAQKILDARPFSRKDQLKKILPKSLYEKVKTFVVAKQSETP